MTMKELKVILNEHEKWLKTRYSLHPEGSRADLYEADLYGADLRRADLRRANLRGADLREADLRGADLRRADLRRANLRGADLYGADLRRANLRGADLYGANLYGANLRRANLRGADLYGADLRRANLRGADLYGANLYGANLYGANLREAICPISCPEEGSFIGFKKAFNNGDVIVKLKITETAKRTSATTRKCRCNEAEVLSITSLSGEKTFDEAVSKYDSSFIYRIAETVRVDDFDENRWNECSTGIHFFITRTEAVNY